MKQHIRVSGVATSLVGTATLIAAVALLIGLSFEILRGSRPHFSQHYMSLQLVVCTIFLLDFAVRIAAEKQKWRFLGRNILFLALSVPYLNIIARLGLTLPHEWAMALTIIPILRVVLAVYLVVQWLIEDGIKRLFAAYALILLLFVYLSALTFYDFEMGRNSALHTFGDALWWAFMNMTTVGSTLTPTTAIGKILAVLLPLSGMLMLPLFTVYISRLFEQNKKSGV